MITKVEWSSVQSKSRVLRALHTRNATGIPEIFSQQNMVGLTPKTSTSTIHSPKIESSKKIFSFESKSKFFDIQKKADQVSKNAEEQQERQKHLPPQVTRNEYSLTSRNPMLQNKSTMKSLFVNNEPTLTKDQTPRKISLLPLSNMPTFTGFQDRCFSQRVCSLNNLERELVDQVFLELFSEYENNYEIIARLEIDQIDLKQDPLQTPSLEEIEPESFRHSLTMRNSMRQHDLQNNGNSINILRYKFYYFRFNIKDRLSPLRIIFKYEEALLTKIFLSRYAAFPNKFNAEFQVNSKFFKLDSDDQTFKDNYLYMTVYSDQDTELNIRISFGQKRKLKARAFQSQIDVQLPGILIHDKDQTDEIKQKSQEFIKRNKDTSPHKNMARYQIQVQKCNIQRQRRMEAAIRKKVIEQSKQIKVKSHLNAQDALKEFRQLERHHNQIKEIKLRISSTWIKSVKLLSTIQWMHQRLQTANKRRRIKAWGRLNASKLYAKWMIKLHKVGRTKQQRLLFNCRQTLHTYCKIIKKRKKGTVKLLITSYLEQVSLFSVMYHNHQVMLNQIITIQRRFRALKKKQRFFKDKVQKIFMRNVVDIIHELKDESKGIQLNPSLASQLQKTRRLFGSQFMIDIYAMNKAIEQFNSKRKTVWVEYVQRTYLDKKQNRAEKIFDIAIFSNIPKLYDLPSNQEVRDMVRSYALSKKII